MISVVLVGPSWSVQKRGPRNKPPVIEEFSSSQNILTICDVVRSSACNITDTFLAVVARDPDGDNLSYEYSPTAGRIFGEGSNVRWDLQNAPRGVHSIKVVVRDGNGGKDQKILSVTLVDCPTCDPPPPPCPTIEISCSKESSKVEVFVCAVDVKDTSKTPVSSFVWRINQGSIIEGQNTRKVKVDTTGIDEDPIVTVEVAGFDPSCVTTVKKSVRIKAG